MRITDRITRAMMVAGLVLSVGSIAEAQASRTWVSGVGDDANPCSRTAPCKTFAGAISKTATNGYINVLDSGGFGAVTITKSITIDGEGFHAGVLASLTNGIIVNGANIIVTLRNLSIEGFGNGLNGIRVANAAEVHVEKCFIANFTGRAIDSQSSSNNTELYVTDTTFKANAAGLISTNGRAFVDNLRAEGNGSGVVAQGTTIVTVRNSLAAGGSIGFGAAIVASSVINVEDSLTTGNDFGIVASQGATARVSNSMVISNLNTGLFNDGVSFIVSLQGNSVFGNPTNGSFTSTVVKQ